ncbi:hypothetical protein CWS72_01435 [Telmatospirillum siberiense]|uniref:DUF4412 domain-containing protein n=2 Tax=Telmatospirillum siberiense TaxID=382514 RepID=A0A2N3Q1L4_9PROT|nr:hypothetical protein CWS72_01435 [Telmatospirillum siberiense]
MFVLAIGALFSRMPESRAAAVGLPELLDAQVEYTAEFYLVSDKGRFQGSVIHAPGRERRDFDTTGGRQALLLRRDIDQAAMMWPERKWYVATSFLSVAGMIGGFDGVSVERKADGTERISGEMTTRYQVSGDSSGGGSFQGRMWVTKDGILMKLVGKVAFNGRQIPVETALSNVLRVKADNAAFVLPADYKGLPLDFAKLGLH